MKLFSVTLIAMFLFVSMCFAQWEELPHNVTRVDFGGVFNKDARSFSITGVKGWEQVWLGLHASQIASEAEIHSETFKAHAQGGHDFGIIEIQAFVNAEKNLIQNIDMQVQGGGYFRKVVAVGDNFLIFSLGNYAENVKVDTETDTDSITTSRWYFGVAAERDFSDKFSGFAKLKGTPHAKFEDLQGSLQVGLNMGIGENSSLGWRSLIQYHDDSHNGDLFFTENSAVLSINF